MESAMAVDRFFCPDRIANPADVKSSSGSGGDSSGAPNRSAVRAESAHVCSHDCSCGKYLLPDAAGTSLPDGIWARALSLHGFSQGRWFANCDHIYSGNCPDAHVLAIMNVL